MSVGEGGSIGPDFSTEYLTSKERGIRIPTINMETGESGILVLRTQEEIDKFLQNLRDQDGEWD